MGNYSFDLGNRVVLITGASSGIGAHVAQALARSGAKVVLAARRAELLEQLKDDIMDGGGDAATVAMDVTDEASIVAAYDAAEAAFGPVDSVIANAGIAIGGSALGLSADDFDQMVAVNLRGVFLTAREGARRMIAAGSAERQHGRIVLVSSITASHISHGKVAYSAAKAGVVQMGRTMAYDWATKGINVNVVCPGYMRTDINVEYFASEQGAKLISGFPRRREMPVDALDPTLLYLSSDISAFVTGSVVTIDDGQSL
jgi:NAD(P)-dependent dehydrogenase (short-subunit alcohol dehydrogenase family)